jgi:hypothetical protein
MAVSLRKKAKVLLDANGNAIDPDQVYVAVDSFCAGVNGEFMIGRGHRLRGSSEAVQHSSPLWLPDGTTDDEIHLVRKRMSPLMP